MVYSVCVCVLDEKKLVKEKERDGMEVGGRRERESIGGRAKGKEKSEGVRGRVKFLVTLLLLNSHTAVLCVQL